MERHHVVGWRRRVDKYTCLLCGRGFVDWLGFFRDGRGCERRAVDRDSMGCCGEIDRWQLDCVRRGPFGVMDRIRIAAVYDQCELGLLEWSSHDRSGRRH